MNKTYHKNTNKIIAVFTGYNRYTYCELLKNSKVNKDAFYRIFQDLLSSGRIIECIEKTYKLRT